MKLTSWFPGDVKPVHVGVYERRPSFNTDIRQYSYWDGSAWHWLGWTAPSAVLLTGIHSAFQDLPWRGVLK